MVFHIIGVAGFSQRQVQDRSYFMGLVRAAMAELGTEVSKLRNQSDEIKSERAASLIYEKRVRELAEELTGTRLNLFSREIFKLSMFFEGLQEQLSDFNLLVDRLNTGAEVSDVNMEIADVARECENVSKEVDNLFSKKQVYEDETKDLKEQLKQVINL